MDFLNKLKSFVTAPKRGFAMVDGIVGAITIIVVVVAIVVMNLIVGNATITGFTGINAIIAGFLATLALVGLLVAAAFIGLRAAGLIK